MNCPCCNQALPKGDEITLYPPLGVVIRGDNYVHVSPAQMAIVYEVHRKHPAPVQLEQIVNTMYAHRHDGGPTDAQGIARVQVLHANKKLKALGIAVMAGSGKRDGYRIINVARPTK